MTAWPLTSRTLLRLRQHAPPPVRVRVRRASTPIWCDGVRCDGLTMERLIRGVLLILIDRRLGDRMAAEVLVHEWAHALAWGRGIPEHGPVFGVLYARAYRASLIEKAPQSRPRRIPCARGRR